MNAVSIVRTPRARAPGDVEAALDDQARTAFGLGQATVHGAGETQWWFDARGATEDAVLAAAASAGRSAGLFLDIASKETFRTASRCATAETPSS